MAGWFFLIEGQGYVTFGQNNDTLHIGLNGTAPTKNVNNCWNTNIYSYLRTSGGQSSNLYLNVVHIFNTCVK